MKLVYFFVKGIIIFSFSNSLCAAVSLTGVGATFPVPIYIHWADKYYKETGDKINYQGIGSSGGIKQIIKKTVDFGCSDSPLSYKKLHEEQLFQFPTVIGGIVPIINVRNISSGQIVLNGKILSEIYLGKIKKWNDPKIISINPNLKLPNQDIIVVHRADGSGTTFIFSKYLTKMDFFWKTNIGYGSIVRWPVGIAGKGNEGVAAFVQRLSGAIGYVEYAYVKQNKLVYAKLISADNEIVCPTENSFKAAAKQIKWDSTFYFDLLNKNGKNVWPITSTTFVLLRKEKKFVNRTISVLKFFAWVYKRGQEDAISLGYAMLPEEIINKIRVLWKNNVGYVEYNNLY